MNIKYWLGYFTGAFIGNVIFQLIVNRELRETVLKALQLLR